MESNPAGPSGNALLRAWADGRRVCAKGSGVQPAEIRHVGDLPGNWELGAGGRPRAAYRRWGPIPKP